MANTLANLAADIYKAADIVGRELVGVIPSVTINAGTERAAFGDTVRSFATRAPTLNTSYTPSMTIPSGDDTTVDNLTATIDQVANVRYQFTGEEQKHLNNGAGYSAVRQDLIAQILRLVTNTIEAHAATKIYQAASRAFGTAGTTPFASNMSDVAEIRQILTDNGTPMDGQVSLVLNSAAGTKMRNLTQLQKVNEAGGGTLLRQGVLQDLQGIMIKESAGIASHVKGAATGALINNASGEAVGQNVLTLDTITVNTTGIKAGDIVTFAADTANKYVVNTGLVATTGDIVIGAPGARILLPDNNAMTIGANYTANVAFHRAAVELVVRPPMMPMEGDAAGANRLTVQDPFSGLVYEIAMYAGYGAIMMDVTTFYAVKVWKPQFCAILMG